MSKSPPILEAKGLAITRGGTLLLTVPSLSVQEGEILSLIGPNGAGKTTLLQTLCCLMKPFEGELFFRGERINSGLSVFGYRRKLAMAFQEPLLFDTTVFNNVAAGLRIRGMEKRKIDQQVEENLNRFGIAHLRHRSTRTLSGGEAQRTSLARALATGPEIFLLDEPFAALDPPSRESLIEDMERILRETKTTTVFATHDRLEALRLSDRIAVMKGGEILQIGPPEEVMNHPMDEFVASFVGVETILDGWVMKRDGGTFVASVSGAEIEAIGDVRLGEEVLLCIRPENVTLSTSALREPTSARNVFFGKIVKIAPMGLFRRVQLECPFPLVAYVTSHSIDHLSLQEGREVKASFKATAIHVVRKKR